MLRERYLDELQVGETASFAKTFTDADVSLFAAMTHESHPLHLDASYAQEREEPRTIPPMLLASFAVSSLLASLVGVLPRLSSCAVEGARAVPLDQTIKATLSVTAIDPAADSVRLDGSCTDESGAEALRFCVQVRFDPSQRSRHRM
jgi:3-hydroxybutyryl-CoA dehydratase